MKRTLLTVAVVILTLGAFIAFGFATISRESEVAMHIFTDEGFARFRIVSLIVGVGVSLLDCFLLMRLYHLWRGTNERHIA